MYRGSAYSGGYEFDPKDYVVPGICVISWILTPHPKAQAKAPPRRKESLQQHIRTEMPHPSQRLRSLAKYCLVRAAGPLVLMSCTSPRASFSFALLLHTMPTLHPS